MSAISLFVFPKQWRYSFVALICILVGAIAAFPLSYFSNANSIVGLALLPFAFFVNGPSRVNYFYLSTALGFGFLAYLYDVRVFYFIALAGYVLFIVEVFFGRLDPLILFLMLLLCPIFSQVIGILGFPIRLQLSQWAGSILESAGLKVIVEGNTMTLDGVDFAVDEACMGLNMLVISLLMGIFVIIHQYRTTGLRLNLTWLFVFFIGVFLMNLVSNVMRIVFLVTFEILPDNPWHEVVGILCLVLYVMVPLYFLASFLIKQCGVSPLEVVEKRTSRRVGIIWLALACLLTLVGFDVRNSRGEVMPQFASATVSGMTVELVANGITKFSNDDLLVYVKPIPQFFTSEHTPLFCWQGSGYELKKVKLIQIAGRQVYSGVLFKGEDKLFTAWWYFNGEIQTIDQTEWRTRMLRGEDAFSLVNVTASDESILQVNIERILRENLITLKEL